LDASFAAAGEPAGPALSAAESITLAGAPSESAAVPDSVVRAPEPGTPTSDAETGVTAALSEIPTFGTTGTAMAPCDNPVVFKSVGDGAMFPTITSAPISLEVSESPTTFGIAET
jgi:hypothetical protein